MSLIMNPNRFGSIWTPQQQWGSDLYLQLNSYKYKWEAPNVLEEDPITMAGIRVTNWVSREGNNFNFGQPTNTYRPQISVINGVNVVASLDEADNSMYDNTTGIGTGFIAKTNFVYAIAIQYGGNNTEYGFIGQISGGGGNSFDVKFRCINNTVGLDCRFAGIDKSVNYQRTDYSTRIVYLVWNDGNTLRGSINGNPTTAGSTNITGLTRTGQNSTYVIFNSNGSAYNLFGLRGTVGAFYEAIHVETDESITVELIQKLEGYMAHRIDQQIYPSLNAAPLSNFPISHPYKTVAP